MTQSIPKDTFTMRGLKFARQPDIVRRWRASTRWGAVDAILTNGQWLVIFVRHGAHVAEAVNRSRLKAFDRVQLALNEMAKLEPGT